MSKYLLLLLGIMGLSIAVLYTTITELDPYSTQATVAYIALFISLFLAGFSVISLLYVGVQWIIEPKEVTISILPVALRRGVLAGGFLCAITGMQLLRVLGVLEALLVGLFIALMEYTFSLSETHKLHTTDSNTTADE